MKRLIKIAIILFFLSTLLFAQFGQNKVQYDVFNWNYIQSKHFNIYFNGDNKAVSDYCAKTAEAAYESISTLLDWDLKKRYAIIVYDSHNDFQQTNTTNSYMPEGVGGFTELFKNRVVVPYEGSYQAFRHVIHHELIHAFMNDLYYSGSIQSLISGAVKLNIPLWLAEGSAEYESSRWDTEADMFMRDFAYNSQFEAYPLEALTGYYAYKGGQSIFKFVRETYGYQKLTEFYTKMKIYLDVNKAIRFTFNMSKEEFTEEWHHYLKKIYWPDISMTEDVKDISVRLTDHKKMRNYQNIAPAISPSGDKIAFLSDKKGYADIYLMNVQDGKHIRRLVRGQRKASLEELKWLSPGISWSADSKHIVFAAKSGQYDALVVVDVENGKQEFYPMPQLQGVFSAAFHPYDNSLIAFTGHNGSQSDIYMYDLDDKVLVNLTNDPEGDSNPQWCYSGENIIYVSERDKSKAFRDPRHPYQTDIYQVSIKNKDKLALTESDASEDYPYSDPKGRGLIYTSDENGIFNIYIKKNDESAYPITNVVGGIFHLNLDQTGENLIFCAFKDYGWDIFRMNDPFEMDKKDLALTRYAKESMATPFDLTEDVLKKERKTRPDDKIKKDKRRVVRGNDNVQRVSDYKNYVFVPTYAYGETSLDSQVVALDSTEIINEEGDYIDKPYKTRFSLDLVDSQFGYSTFYGMQGQATFMFSDVMGDHQVYIGTDLYIDLQNSDYALAYYYRKYRPNFGFVLQNQSDNYITYISGEVSETNPYGYFVTRYTNRSLHFIADYPINKHLRFELNNSYYYVRRDLLDKDQSIAAQYDADIHEYRAELALVKDNTVFSYTAPMDGSRYRLSLEMSPKITPETPEFYSAKLDYRQYLKLNDNYHLAFRFNGGASFGPNPQTFLLGGIDNWINYYYNADAPIFGNSGESFSEQLSMYYLSEYIMPVRGAAMFQTWGDKFILMNAELRFPFIEYAKLGLPPIQFFQVRGVLFADAGFAWTDELNLVKNNGWFIGNEWDDLIGSVGMGVRVYLGFALLRIDCAWEYNGEEFSSPRWLWSLGGDL